VNELIFTAKETLIKHQYAGNESSSNDSQYTNSGESNNLRQRENGDQIIDYNENEENMNNLRNNQ
jgi:hypothetical protein